MFQFVLMGYQSLRAEQKALVKVISTLIAAVFFTLAAIGEIGLVSLTAPTRASVHSIMTYWASITAVICILILQKNNTKSRIALATAFIIPILIHMGSAVSAIRSSGSIIIIDSWNLAETTLKLFMITLFLTSAIWFWKKDTQLTRYGLAPLFLVSVSSSLLYAAIWYFILPNLTVLILQLFGLLLGLASIILLLFGTTKMLKEIDTEFPLDPGWFASGCILLITSTIILFLPITDSWIYSENVEMAAFFIFGLSAGGRFLKSVGFNRVTAYAIVLILLIAAYIPLLITVIIETGMLSVPVAGPNIMAFSIIQISAVFLAAMMAYLLYVFSRRSPAWMHYPLILMLSLWASVAAVSIASAVMFLPGEPIVPYLVGSLLSLLLIVIVINRVSKPRKSAGISSPVLKLLLATFVLLAAIVTGEVANQYVISLMPALATDPLGRSLLHTSNLVVMFAFAYLIFLLLSRTAGRLTTEIYVTIFLSMWTIPNILISFFSKNSTGWWLSQILVFASLLAGPVFLALLYAGIMREAEESHVRATLYADLLMHDQTNYNQIAMTALELIMFQELTSDQREQIAQDAHDAIVMSDKLIGNVRLLSESERIAESMMVPVDIVACIVEALDQITHKSKDVKGRVHIKAEELALTTANELVLVGMLRNLIASIVDESPSDETVLVEVKPVTDEGKSWWKIQITAVKEIGLIEHEGIGIRALSLQAAEFVSTSFGGSISSKLFTHTDGKLMEEVIIMLSAR